MKRSLFFVLFCLLVIVPVSAQDAPILIVSVPEWLYDTLDSSMVAPFEAQYGVRVEIVNSQTLSFYGYGSSENINEYLDSAERYVRSADVLFIEPWIIGVETTRAGMFLDLAPLAFDDPTLDVNDFYPGVWGSFQWDDGIWGIPLAASLHLLLYDHAALDNAGVPYPSESWTLDDFANAGRTLAQAGIMPGMFAAQPEMLFRALLGTGFYDPSILPNPLSFPENLAPMLETWAQLEREGIIARINSGMSTPSAPITIARPVQIDLFADNRTGTLLPGGVSVVEPQGFGISAGTAHPELAYELAKFLSFQPQLAENVPADIPARHSVLEFTSYANRSEEIQSLMDMALDNPLPFAELRYGDRISTVLDRMVTEGISASDALVATEQTIIDALAHADERRATTQIVIDNLVPSLTDGEIALNFSVFTTISPLPDRENWEQVAADFAALDPEVGYIEFIGQFATLEIPAEADCFYLPWNAADTLDSQTIRNLDPFLDADVDFIAEDVVGNTLEQLTRDGKIWGYPVAVQPIMMWADAAVFNQAGAFLPDNSDWAVDEFNVAIELLRHVIPPDQPVFSALSRDSNPLLMLIASYGGLPLDYRTSPPTIQFTDPVAVSAMRQVLDQAKSGDIGYMPLDVPTSMFNMQLTPIYAQALPDIGLSSALVSNEPNMVMLTFPSGNQHTPVSYTIDAGYIAADTPYAEPCYRWLKFLAQNSYRFNGVPAFLSIYAEPGFTATVSPERQGFYQTWLAMLQSPNSVIFPSQRPNSPTRFDRIWLHRAMDNYVFDNADPETELSQAQQMTEAYRACAANVAPLETITADEYTRQLADCVIGVDPTLSERIGN